MRQRLATLMAFLLVTFAAAPPSVEAWGASGHRIIGHMARELLTPDTRAALRTLMGRDDVATMALHMDQHKDRLDREIPGSRAWHYDDVPMCVQHTHDTYCLNGHCASTQIERHRRILVDVHEPKRRKQFAVFVLTHLIGDIHQPLHAADNDDRGGNEVKVRLPDGRRLNLHAAWDTAIVDQLYGGQYEVAVARKLVDRYRARSTAWLQGRSRDWIKEAHHLAVDVAYGKLPGFRCGGEAGATRIELADDYLDNAARVVETQLAKAGYRLALILNQVLGD